MPIESNPRPDNIPQRPRLTAAVLRNLYASDVIANNPSPTMDQASKWLADMRTWATWASEYCKRLDAVYVEHLAIFHYQRAEPGALADADLIGFKATTAQCKVCAYLLGQHESNQL